MMQRWAIRPHDPGRVGALSREAGVPPLIAQILLNRGASDAASARAFLEVRRDGLHDPGLLPGVEDAAARVVRAIRDRRPVVIYGDYDVDGVCGTSLLWSCFRLAGAPESLLDYYIPSRVDEGYGLNSGALAAIAAKWPGALVVTVDCGVTAVEEAKAARALGLELIVTDHHTPGPEWPEADVLVHPRAVGGRYPFPDLCGAGVAFKLAWQVCKGFGDGKRASPHLRDFLLRAINLVALATVADVMPLEGENRIFVKHGLAGLSADPSVGLQALMQVSGCLGRERISTGQIGFGIAPRINAAGRLALASKAVELLTTADPARAMELASELDDCNRKRQDVERQITHEARAILEDRGGIGDRGGLVVGRSGWHPGVIGIVAGRLAETYHRPTVVVALGPEHGQGSGRSVPGFDLHAALGACAGSLTSYGGHKAAAGLRVAAARFDEFASRFDDYCGETLTPDQRQKTLHVDAEVRLGELTRRVVDAIEALEPFGISNPRPVFVAEGVRLAAEPKAVGEKRNHVQLRFAQGDLVVKAIGWNLAERTAGIRPGTTCGIAFCPGINEWNGRREVQLEIKDFRLAEPAAEGRIGSVSLRVCSKRGVDRSLE